MNMSDKSNLVGIAHIKLAIELPIAMFSCPNGKSKNKKKHHKHP